MTFALILKGIALGIGAAVPIGPVNVEIARRTLRNGFRAGFALGCGAVTVDIAYAVLTSVGLRPLLDSPAALQVLAVAAAAILTYLGVGCFVSAARERRAEAVEPTTATLVSSRRNYLTGLVMTAVNPFTLLFWFAAVPGSVGQITRDPARDLPVVCAGVFLGAFSWVIAFTTTLSILGRFSRRTWLMAANLAGGTALLGFAGWTVFRVLQGSLF
jgi:L-lysine exporter family protein LysE/ArgO